MPNVPADLPIDDEQMPDLYNLADTVVVRQCAARARGVIVLQLFSADNGVRQSGPWDDRREISLIMGEAGLLITPSDSNAIVEAFSTLVADAELRQAFGKNARE